MKFYSILSFLSIMIIGLSSCKKEMQNSAQREEIVYKQKLKDLLHFKETGTTDLSRSDFKTYKDAYLFFSGFLNKSQESETIITPITASAQKTQTNNATINPDLPLAPSPHYQGVITVVKSASWTLGLYNIGFTFRLEFDAQAPPSGFTVMFVNRATTWLNTTYSGPGSITVNPATNWVQPNGPFGGTSQGSVSVGGTVLSFIATYNGSFYIQPMSLPLINQPAYINTTMTVSVI